MFIPVEGKMGQHIWVVDKDADGNVKKEMQYGVRYVPLTDPPKP
jgi:protein-L-isoaspartate(D-aspartate) O-methyltransferase